MFFKCKQLHNISKLTNYSVNSFVLINYCFNIKILIDATFELFYCSNLSLVLDLLILQLLRLLRLNLLLN